nr:uncharacterized protein LOC129277153 [Lytechinus pictus]XP_054769343.1 uncharacterized protein LOC129277155 [Lytechinus pictus]
MESSSITTWCLVWASMIVEAFGESSKNQETVDSGPLAVIAPALLIALAVSIMAVAALSIRALRRQEPSEISIHLGKAAFTAVDVNALGPPSLALDLDDDNILEFDDEEEEEDEATKEEVKTRRLGNLAQVMKSGRFFRGNGMEELPYSPRHCRRWQASSQSQTR